MKTEWDYSDLASSYVKRPDYSSEAIDELLKTIKLDKKALICDIGAGVGHLTLMLGNKGYQIIAVEPNDNMRNLGKERTAHLQNIQWVEGTGEDTKQPTDTFDLVTFGSSFNVTDRQKALKETWRILKNNGWFACMWNHRDLDDPIQMKIENIIKLHVPDYSYGTRREDQTDIIEKSGLFDTVKKIEHTIIHSQSKEDCLTAWRSHGTVHRQSKEKFNLIISQISKTLDENPETVINIPYATRIWFAQKKVQNSNKFI